MTTTESVELIDRTTAYKGFFEIGRYRFRHSLFAGGMSALVTREVFERRPAVCVLPYDPVRDQVLLIRQIRVGALAAGRHPWIWETVAGIVDDEETAEAVACREAREEADLAIGDLIHMQTFLVSPGGASEVCSCYLGRADLATAGGIHGLADESEDILARVVDWPDALAMLERGEIGSSLAVIALQWLALHRDKVRSRWR